MAKRSVNVAMILFLNGKGQTLYGFRGEEVDVHADDLDRFDGLNGEQVEPLNEPPHPEEFLDPTAPDGPEPLDHGTTDDEDGPLEEPAESAPKADWVAYAEQEGVDTDGLTKAEIIAEFRE